MSSIKMKDMNFEMPTGQVSNSDKLSERLDRMVKELNLPGDCASKSLSETTLPSNQATGTQFLFKAQAVTAATLRSSGKFTSF